MEIQQLKQSAESIRQQSQIVQQTEKITPTKAQTSTKNPTPTKTVVAVATQNTPSTQSPNTSASTTLCKDLKNFATEESRMNKEKYDGMSWDSKVMTEINKGNYTLAISYSQNAIDLFDSAHKINLDNKIPSSSPSDLYEILYELKDLHNQVIYRYKEEAETSKQIATNLSKGLDAQSLFKKVIEMMDYDIKSPTPTDGPFYKEFHKETDLIDWKIKNFGDSNLRTCQ
jgi:hypothetical protein